MNEVVKIAAVNGFGPWALFWSVIIGLAVIGIIVLGAITEDAVMGIIVGLMFGVVLSLFVCGAVSVSTSEQVENNIIVQMNDLGYSNVKFEEADSESFVAADKDGTFVQGMTVEVAENTYAILITDGGKND